MEVVADNFRAGHPTKIGELVEKTGLSEPVARQMVETLVQGELIHLLAGAERSVTLAQSPEQIRIDRLMEIGFQLVDTAQLRPSTLNQQLRQAQLQAAAGNTLATAVAE